MKLTFTTDGGIKFELSAALGYPPTVRIEAPSYSSSIPLEELDAIILGMRALAETVRKQQGAALYPEAEAPHG